MLLDKFGSFQKRFFGTTEAKKMSELRTFDGVALVYFVQAINDGPIKISATCNLARRMAALEAASPYPLTLLGVIRDPSAVQRKQRLHRRFTSAHSHGDWFRPVEALSTYIEAYAVHVLDTADDDAEAVDGSLVRDLTDVDSVLEQIDTAAALMPLWTVDQMAAHLQVGPATVLRYVRAGTLPCLRIGRQIRFYQPAVIAYLKDVSDVVGLMTDKGSDPFVD